MPPPGCGGPPIGRGLASPQGPEAGGVAPGIPGLGGDGCSHCSSGVIMYSAEIVLPPLREGLLGLLVPEPLLLVELPGVFRRLEPLDRCGRGRPVK
jgi:hypothetical protein